MKLKDTPIRKKLLSVMMITSASVLGLMCIAYIALEYISFRKNLKTNTEILGAVIASNSSAALAFLSVDDANEILNALTAEKHIVAACLYDRNGKLFAKFPKNTNSANFPAKPDSLDSYQFNKSYLEGFQSVFQGDAKLGTLYIRSELNAMYAQLQYFIIVGFLLISGSLIVAYVLSNVLQRSISDPILALEETAKVISNKHDYSVRAVKFGNDEVGALTDAFNIMLTQIQTQNKEIVEFNQNLEQKVRERTADLQHQKDFVETIINSSVDVVAVFDKDLNYIMLNQRADEMYPIKRKDLIGKNILSVYPQTKESGMYDALKRALNGETVHDISYKSKILNKSFENFYIPLKDNNRTVYGVLAIGHDISNVMEVNDKLEMLNRELLKSNKDLEQFAYVASHDLQEPLRKIQTFTQILNNSSDNEEQIKYYIGKINQSAFRMQQLIQDVLNFSRISNSDDAIIPTDLNKIVENLKLDFELLLKEKDAVIICPELPVIQGIPMQLTQLFSNLISNSIKYNDKQPVIKILFDYPLFGEIEKFTKLKKSLSYIRIQFEDNGIGFEPKFSEQIFDIFQRLHGKQAYSGTGIGLALCKKIVENHGGLIFAEGMPGEGAKFTIILPI
ncbi:MAG TPA: ATP-binding protein [Bacteroidia bacterium]|nr:ATP-binding protein [Bacteroidia bacterium]